MKFSELRPCGTAVFAAGEHSGHSLNRLALPRAGLLWMQLMFYCDLLNGFVATQRFQRQLGH